MFSLARVFDLFCISYIHALPDSFLIKQHLANGRMASGEKKRKKKKSGINDPVTGIICHWKVF